MDKIKPSIEIKAKIRSERALILSDIIEELQKESNTPVDKRWLAVKTSHLSKDDLRYCYDNAKRYKNETGKAFSKAFHGMLKVA